MLHTKTHISRSWYETYVVKSSHFRTISTKHTSVPESPSTSSPERQLPSSSLPIITLNEMDWIPASPNICKCHPSLVKPRVLRLTKAEESPISKSLPSSLMPLSPKIIVWVPEDVICIGSPLQSPADVRALLPEQVYTAVWEDPQTPSVLSVFPLQLNQADKNSKQLIQTSQKWAQSQKSWGFSSTFTQSQGPSSTVSCVSVPLIPAPYGWRPLSTGALTATPYPSSFMTQCGTETVVQHTVSHRVTLRTAHGESEDSSHLVVIQKPYLMMEEYMTLAQPKSTIVASTLPIRDTTWLVKADVHQPYIHKKEDAGHYMNLTTEAGLPHLSQFKIPWHFPDKMMFSLTIYVFFWSKKTLLIVITGNPTTHPGFLKGNNSRP